LATKLQAIEAGIREMPVVDEAKVNAAKQAVESGNLRLDAEALANALARFEIDLFES
jgi:flagellar biosynthesis anti-sigma factor FlgM